MSTITAAQRTTLSFSASSPTRFERTLLRAASALNGFVVVRLERRTGSGSRHALAAQNAVIRRRRDAEARGAIGILPR